MGAIANVVDEIDEREKFRREVVDFFERVGEAGLSMNAAARDLSALTGVARASIYRWRSGDALPIPVLIPVLRSALTKLEKKLLKS